MRFDNATPTNGLIYETEDFYTFVFKDKQEYFRLLNLAAFQNCDIADVRQLACSEYDGYMVKDMAMIVRFHKDEVPSYPGWPGYREAFQHEARGLLPGYEGYVGITSDLSELEKMSLGNSIRHQIIFLDDSGLDLAIVSYEEPSVLYNV